MSNWLSGLSSQDHLVKSDTRLTSDFVEIQFFKKWLIFSFYITSEYFWVEYLAEFFFDSFWLWGNFHWWQRRRILAEIIWQSVHVCWAAFGYFMAPQKYYECWTFNSHHWCLFFIHLMTKSCYIGILTSKFQLIFGNSIFENFEPTKSETYVRPFTMTWFLFSRNTRHPATTGIFSAHQLS